MEFLNECYSINFIQVCFSFGFIFQVFEKRVEKLPLAALGLNFVELFYINDSYKINRFVKTLIQEKFMVGKISQVFKTAEWPDSFCANYVFFNNQGQPVNSIVRWIFYRHPWALEKDLSMAWGNECTHGYAEQNTQKSLQCSKVTFKETVLQTSVFPKSAFCFLIQRKKASNVCLSRTVIGTGF